MKITNAKDDEIIYTGNAFTVETLMNILEEYPSNYRVEFDRNGYRIPATKLIIKRRAKRIIISENK